MKNTLFTGQNSGERGQSPTSKVKLPFSEKNKSNTYACWNQLKKKHFGFSINLQIINYGGSFIKFIYYPYILILLYLIYKIMGKKSCVYLKCKSKIYKFFVEDIKSVNTRISKKTPRIPKF